MVAAVVVAAGGADVVMVVGGDDDMIEREQSDTKLVGTTSLPGLGRRL